MNARQPVVPPRHPGSTGNVIAALASFFIPGLGQLLQGRVLWALAWFVLSCFVWLVGVLTFGLLAFLGTIVHLLSCIHAALYRPFELRSSL
jgi:hypothetical protein